VKAPLDQRLASPDARTRLDALGEVLRDEVPRALVDPVIRLLDDADARVRRGALEVLSLGADGGLLEVPPALWRRALELRRDQDAGVRAQVAVALATLPGVDVDEVAPALLGLLRDDAPPVRRDAAAALGDLRLDRAKEPLAERLDRDPDAETRFEAAFALASLRDVRALDPLVEALGGPRLTDACEGLKRLGDPRAGPVLRAHAQRFFLGWPERILVHATLYALGERADAAAYLLSRLTAWNRGERELAIATLGHLRAEEAREAIEAIAIDRRDRARGVAITALGELGDARSLAVLDRLSGDAGVADDVAHARAALSRRAH
jgi:HEAT repeat protein